MTNKRIYFLGIGGIGMSALAQYFLAEGDSIYGYDLTPSLPAANVTSGFSVCVTWSVFSPSNPMEVTAITLSVRRSWSRI